MTVPRTKAGREYLTYIRQWSEDEGAFWTQKDEDTEGARIVQIEEEARSLPPNVDHPRRTVHALGGDIDE